jgi:hypothetical protein
MLIRGIPLLGVGPALKRTGMKKGRVMSRRLTWAVPVVLAASVVAISLGATTGDAADECLSGPKGTAPQGSHWYYRVERSSGRHCWYLGSEGQKVRSVSERTSQQTRKRVAQHSQRTETTAPEPAVRSSAPVAIAETKTVASFFSQYWSSLFSGAEPPKVATAEEPKFALAADASRPAPPAATTNYAQEQDHADAQDEMPLVWPVLTAAEKEAATAPATTSVPTTTSVSVPALKSQHMVAILAGALAIAGILMALVYRLGSIRFGRKQQQRQNPRWDITNQTAERLPLAPPPLAYADSALRPSVAARKPVLSRRPAELDREGREPGEARRLRELRELREGLENKLEELRDAHKRSAA